MATESSSTAIIKSNPERGQPCLTPRCSKKNGDEKPLLMMQLDILLKMTLSHFLKFSPEVKDFQGFVQEIPFQTVECFLKVKENSNPRQVLVKGKLKYV